MQFIIALSVFISVATADYRDLYSSTFQMARLLEREIEFVDTLRSFVDKNNTISDKIKTYIERVYSNFHPDAKHEKYVAHPVNALGVLKRTGFDYQIELRPFVEQNLNASEVLRNLKKLTDIFPDAFAYADACSGVALLQEAYKLDAVDLADGRVQAVLPEEKRLVSYEGDFKLSWYEMFQIGAMSCNRGWYDTCLNWFDLALENAPKKARNRAEAEKLKEFRQERNVAIKFHDHFLEKRGPIHEKSRTFPVPRDEKLRKKKKYKKLIKENAKAEKLLKLVPLFNTSFSLEMARDNFYVICQNGTMQERGPETDSKFSCRYQHHGDPYLKLGPLKLEEVNEDPFLVVFKDLIYDKEIKHLKARASPSLQRSEFGGTDKASKTGLTRTSKQSWVHERFFTIPNGTYDENGKPLGEGFLIGSDLESTPELPGMPFKEYMTVIDPIVYTLSRRIGLATQLEILAPFSSEVYQVANYGIGGQYNTHFDAVGSQWPAAALKKDRQAYDQAYGDRIATFMGYIEEVPLGGATAFPFIGKAVQPEKGSAVFWLNLNPRGDINRLSAHGGCPVLVGSKWITNKWIGGFDQWHTLKCGLNPNSKFDLLQVWRNADKPQVY